MLPIFPAEEFKRGAYYWRLESTTETCFVFTALHCTALLAYNHNRVGGEACL